MVVVNQQSLVQQYKRPESVLVVIYTREGQVLLLERSQPSHFWQSVTGSLEWQEQPVKAALREVREETGLDASGQLLNYQVKNRFPIHPQWRSRYHPDTNWNCEYVFGLQLAAALPVRLHPSEHVRYQWVSKLVALNRVSSSTNRAAILRFVP